MELKDYQQQALDTLDRYLEALKEARQKADEWAALLSSKEISDTLGETALAVTRDVENYPYQAWESLRKASVLPGVTDAQGQDLIPEHISRQSTAGEPIPHVCLKVPTGGGKTLLGVEAVRRLKLGTGFVLWLVPTKAIYTQTWDAFRNKEHPYRQILERASGGRVKLLQKDDRFTKQDIENHLCVMLLMLPPQTGTETRNSSRFSEIAAVMHRSFPLRTIWRSIRHSQKNIPTLKQQKMIKPHNPGSPETPKTHSSNRAFLTS